MFPRLKYLVHACGDHDRQLIISGVIMAIICVALYINLIIMLTKRSSDQNTISIRNGTKNMTTSSPIISTKTLSNDKRKYKNYSLPNHLPYETRYGESLGNSIHINILQLIDINGYISQLHLRLFTNWEGNASLYIFIPETSFSSLMNRVHRYPVEPQRNTTEWQIIPIPLYAVPVSLGKYLGIGMLDCTKTNQIYIVNNTGSFTARNLTHNTSQINLDIDRTKGFAIGFSVAQYVKKLSN
ncbi:hypothetical protein I4U23_001308 [Adineta vaga]|nr:hypothetical protein I4U23_001308 [Adineta vaga]